MAMGTDVERCHSTFGLEIQNVGESLRRGDRWDAGIIWRMTGIGWWELTWWEIGDVI